MQGRDCSELTTGVTDAEVYAAAVAFRRALERCDLRALGPTLEHFPHGSCGDASLLLREHLMRHGAGPFEYVSAERGDRAAGTWTSHAWLERDGLIVDVTADQFGDETPPVLVTRDSPLHRTFAEVDRRPGDYRAEGGYAAAMLAIADHAIRAQMGDARM